MAAASECKLRHGVIGIDFDTVVSSKLPRAFFVSDSQRSFVARGIEIQAQATTAAVVKQRKNLRHSPDRRTDRARFALRERRITIQLSVVAQKSRTVSHLLRSAEQTDRE